ncbi:MAG: hypothetical protein ACYC0L_03125 [Thermoleophilia bacterium]
MNGKDFEKLKTSVRQAGKIRLGKMKPSRFFKLNPADIKHNQT